MSRRTLAVLAVVLAAAVVALLVWQRRAHRTRPAAPTTTAAAPRAVGADPHRLPPARVAGLVREPAGAALAGAQVCAVTADAEAGARRARQGDNPTCVTTGADGRFALAGLAAGRYGLYASAADHAPGRWTAPDGGQLLSLAPGDDRAELVLVLPTGGAAVTGRVVDVSGGPIAGAVVWAVEPATFAREVQRPRGAFTTSGPDGRFRLAAGGGNLSLAASADGYTDGQVDGVAPGQDVEVALWPAATVGGVVVTPDGAPVAGAAVWADDGHGEHAGRTGSDGRFRFARLAPGRITIAAASATGRGESPGSFAVRPGQTVDDLRLVLWPAAAVVAHVVRADGTPCGGAEVRLARWPTAGVLSTRADADGDGRAELLGLTPGTYEVGLTCPGHRQGGELSLEVPAATPVTEVTWKLVTGATVRGTVTGPGGAPVPGATVVIVVRRFIAEDATTTAADGSYRLGGLVGGRYAVTARAPGLTAPEPVDVDLADDADVRVDLVLGAGGAITGVVVDGNDRPQADVAIEASGGDGQAQATTDQAGRFTLDGLAPGPWTVSAEADTITPGDAAPTASEATATVVSGATATVRLVVSGRDGVITGTVVDSAGAPARECEVTAEQGDGVVALLAGTGSAVTLGPALTGDDGRFTLRRVGAGAFAVLARRADGASARVEGVSAGDDVTVRLDTTGAVVGTVTMAGAPVPEALVVTAEHGDTVRTESFRHTDGRFTLRDLPPATYQLAVDAIDGVGVGSATVTAGGEAPVTIALEPTVTLRGRLVERVSRAPVAGMGIRVERAGASLPRGMTSARSAADGTFELRHAPRGHLEVSTIGRLGGDDDLCNGEKLVDVGAGPVVDVGDVELVRRLVPRGEPEGDLGLTWKLPAEGGVLELASLTRGGPAARAGLQVGDAVVAIDGNQVEGRLATAFCQVAVPAGTALRLRVRRGPEVTLTAR